MVIFELMLDKTMQRAIVHRPLLKRNWLEVMKLAIILLRSEGTWRSSVYVS